MGTRERRFDRRKEEKGKNSVDESGEILRKIIRNIPGVSEQMVPTRVTVVISFNDVEENYLPGERDVS